MRRSIDSKPIRTTNNKPLKSGIIRKGSMPHDEIKKIAQELQPEVVNQCDGCMRGLPVVNGIHDGGQPGGKFGCTKERYLTPQVVEEVQAPAIEVESVCSPERSYREYASRMRLYLQKEYTMTIPASDLVSTFPHSGTVSKIVYNLKKYHGIDNRLSKKKEGNEYIFFIGETEKEKIQRLENTIIDLNTLNQKTRDEYHKLSGDYDKSQEDKVVLIQRIEEIKSANKEWFDTYKEDIKSQKEVIEDLTKKNEGLELMCRTLEGINNDWLEIAGKYSKIVSKLERSVSTYKAITIMWVVAAGVFAALAFIYK